MRTEENSFTAVCIE